MHILPNSAVNDVGKRGFGLYVHVPFCSSRCGYCDFNTYTPSELGGLRTDAYVEAALLEIGSIPAAVGQRPRVDTIFFGGGTPTLLPPKDLARLLDAIAAACDVSSDAEVTIEANPESVDVVFLTEIRRAGFTRLSLGMQSARSHVLASLDRRHTPGRPAQVVEEAKAAGFAHVNLDLIYGAAGETSEDWAASLEAVCQAGVDHVSAYALIVEQGTALARRIRKGELSAPEDDTLADRYLEADKRLHEGGFTWYEVSNWARSAEAQCRHNMLYWSNGDWWGVGPGAHSHIGGTRWWNVKHPTRYVSALTSGESPKDGSEVLDELQRHTEEVMLGIRLSRGLDVEKLGARGLVAAKQAAIDGLLDARLLESGRVVLTLSGRLLADAVVRALT